MRAVFLSSLVLLGIPLEASAQLFEGARALSLAEAQRALGTANDAIYLNPAAMALGRVYSLELNYADDLSDELRRFGASIVDSKQNQFLCAGLSYMYLSELMGLEGDLERRMTGHRLDLALAGRITNSFGAGLTGRYLNYSESLGGESLDPSGYDQLTLDAGLAWRHDSGLGVGLTTYNLTKPDVARTPLSWGAGVGYQGEAFSGEIDVRYNLEKGKARYSLGLSYVIGTAVPLRLGGSYDLLDKSAEITGGIGYQTKEFGADIGYRQRLTIDEPLKGTGIERLLALAVRLSFF